MLTSVPYEKEQSRGVKEFKVYPAWYPFTCIVEREDAHEVAFRDQLALQDTNPTPGHNKK